MKSEGYNFISKAKIAFLFIQMDFDFKTKVDSAALRQGCGYSLGFWVIEIPDLVGPQTVTLRNKPLSL